MTMAGHGRWTTGAALALWALLAPWLAARAADLSVVEGRATLHDELVTIPSSNRPGLVVRLRPHDDKQFLVVDLQLAVKWAEEDKNLNVKTDDIALLDGKGAKLPMVGRCSPTGFFQRYSVAIYLHKPHDKKSQARPVPFHAVFVVPRGAKAFTFQAGALKHKLAASEPGKAPSPADYAAFKIAAAKLVPQAQDDESMGYKKPKARRTVQPAFGKLLALTIEITPKQGNHNRADYFYMSTWDLGLRFGKGAFVPAIGQEHGNFGYASNVSMNLHANPDGSWKPVTYTFYFAVPEDIKSFTLTYLLTPVANGRLGD